MSDVHDEVEKVAEGTHERFIIEADRRRSRLEQKLPAWRSRVGR